MASKTSPADAAQAPVESKYSVSDFAANSMTLFGARKECVIAAMKSAKVDSCTLSEAKEIVTAFLKKEVK